MLASLVFAANLLVMQDLSAEPKLNADTVVLRPGARFSNSFIKETYAQTQRALTFENLFSNFAKVYALKCICKLEEEYTRIRIDNRNIYALESFRKLRIYTHNYEIS